MGGFCPRGVFLGGYCPGGYCPKTIAIEANPHSANKILDSQIILAYMFQQIR